MTVIMMMIDNDDDSDDDDDDEMTTMITLCSYDQISSNCITLLSPPPTSMVVKHGPCLLTQP